LFLNSSLFRSFFIGGFECSSHRVRSGKRLDLLAATQHHTALHVLADYQRLQAQGILTVREGLRWHLIETKPGFYDFSSVRPMLAAAQATGMQIIWDLFHYGWPDDLDIFAPAFIDRFANLTRAFTQLLADETDTNPLIVPVNEISFVAWAGGDVAYMNPFAQGRDSELKIQLIRASIAATEAVWQILPQARIVQIEPVINIVASPDRPQGHHEAEAYRLAQYQSLDVLAGRLWPEVGGQEKYLDIIGVNYYPINQWFNHGRTIHRHEPQYKPFRHILAEVYSRYQRPLFIAETGTEGWMRPGWLQYVSNETRAAISVGTPVEGICLYPILNHPGWDNERYCPNGLWDYVDEQGERPIYAPLARELRTQQRLFAQMAPSSMTEARSFDPINGAATKATPSKLAVISGVSRLPRAPTICLFTDSLALPGIGEHMLAIASELSRVYPLLFVCPANPKGDYVLDRAAKLGCKLLSLDLRDERAASALLRRHLRKSDVEIFHAHAGGNWEGHLGISVAREVGVRVVIRTEHLPYLLSDTAERLAYAKVLQAVDQLICVSNAAYRSYLHAGVPAEKLKVIRNGICVPAPSRDRAGLRAQLGLPPTAKIILTVAGLNEQKGHRYLVEAMPTVLQHEPDARFVWVGEGPLEAELCQQIQAIGIDPAHVVFAGYRRDVPELLGAADLFVLPSLFEGLPLVVLEAMAIGVPVVATQVGGTREAIEDGVTGRLVPAYNSSALAAAIVEVFTQPNTVDNWCQASRERIDRRFSSARMVGEMVTIYERMRKQPRIVEPEPKRPVNLQPAPISRVCSR